MSRDSDPGKARAILNDALGGGIGTAELDAFAATAALAPRQVPPAALRARLLAGVAQPRYAWLDRVVGLLDLGVDHVRTLLDELYDPASWGTTPTPGVLFRHLNAGPACAGAVVGFVLVPGGRSFPHHVHLGPEQVLVLQGGFKDVSGLVCLPGDRLLMPAGSEHHFDALPGEDLIYLAVVFKGVAFAPEAGGVILA